MAEISMFMICDSVGNDNPQPDVNISHLSGPQVVLRPQFIPGNFSFGIAAGVIGVDLRKSNSFSCSILNPDGSLLQDLGNAAFPIFPDDDPMPKEYQGFMLTIDVRNLVVNSEGAYLFKIQINGEEIGTRQIPIFRAKKK